MRRLSEFLSFRWERSFFRLDDLCTGLESFKGDTLLQENIRNLNGNDTAQSTGVFVENFLVYYSETMWYKGAAGWPHSRQDEIPCVFLELHKFPLFYYHPQTNFGAR